MVKAPLQAAGLNLLAAAVLAAAAGLLATALILALAPVVGAAGAFALTGSIAALAGAGLWLAARGQRQQPAQPPPPQPQSLDTALANLVVVALTAYLRDGKSRSSRRGAD